MAAEYSIIRLGFLSGAAVAGDLTSKTWHELDITAKGERITVKWKGQQPVGVIELMGVSFLDDKQNLRREMPAEAGFIQLILTSGVKLSPPSLDGQPLKLSIAEDVESLVNNIPPHAIKIWFRLPNVLLRMPKGLVVQPGVNKDEVWIGVGMDAREKSISTQIGLLGGSTINEVILFDLAKAKSSVRLPPVEEFGALDGKVGSAVEQLLGLEAREDLVVEWIPEEDTVARLRLRRAVVCTPVAADPWFFQIDKTWDKLLLHQRPRKLGEMNASPALRTRAWFLQPSYDAEPLDQNQKAMVPKMLGKRFSNRWKALMESFQGRLENQTTALFGLECAAVEGMPTFDLASNRSGQFRVEPRPPFGRSTGDFSGTYLGNALQYHQTGNLTLEARISPGLPRLSTVEPGSYAIPVSPDMAKAVLDDTGVTNTAANFQAWKLSLKLTLESSSIQQGQVRVGALDLRFGGKRKAAAAPCLFIFHQSESSKFDCVSALQLKFLALGWEKVAAAAEGAMRLGNAYWISKGLSLPVAEVLPGECDHDPSEVELKTSTSGQQRAAQRPLLILSKSRADSPADHAGKPILLLSEIAGHDFTREFDLRLKLTETRKPSSEDERGLQRFLYLDRAPFFVGLFSIPSILDFDLQQGNEAAYLTTKGVFRGWQLRATAYEYELHLPPQGVGEAMEKGPSSDGYHDIEPGQPVEFRFPPPTTLKIASSDLDRRYGNTPWNLRLTLNSLRETSQVGLPLREAHLEMLYGLRFHIRNVPHLRIAELFTRQGFPRRPLPSLPAAREFLRVGNGGDPKSVDAYQKKVSEWSLQLEVLDSRLAVYEVFDDRQVDFDQKGEPVGLALEGPAGSKQVSADLRKSAVLRTSLPSKPGTESLAPFEKRPLVEIDVASRTNEFGKNLNIDTRNWWAKLIPNYEGGLAGSFAWAFESKLLYESLWQDPNPSTPEIVEAVEATIARLYFSALGGWSSQRASFSNGRIVVVVTVEMGRVSELRVEVVGRIGVFWNKAKFVTVFRRSVLPTLQFYDQQDRHAGRPLLRKVEEYVEFLQKYRPFLDEVTQLADPSLAGCVKACSCDEKVLVDSRWGTDVYDDKDHGVGWKVPLRRIGAPAHIYGPANVLLHFHADPQAPQSDVAGHIENLENLWFWTDVRKEFTADTDRWPAIAHVDIFEGKANQDTGVLEDGVNGTIDWKQDKSTWEQSMIWGTPAVPDGAHDYTFRIGGISTEANLTHHLTKPDEKPAERRPVGSVLRNVTVSRGQIMAENTDHPRQSISQMRGALENTVSLLEQLERPSAPSMEEVTGWEDEARKLVLAAIPKDYDTKRLVRMASPLVAAVHGKAAALDGLKDKCRRAFTSNIQAVNTELDKWKDVPTSANLKSFIDARTATFNASLSTLFSACEQAGVKLKAELEKWLNPLTGEIYQPLIRAVKREFAGHFLNAKVEQFEKALTNLIREGLTSIHLPKRPWSQLDLESVADDAPGLEALKKRFGEWTQHLQTATQIAVKAKLDGLEQDLKDLLKKAVPPTTVQEGKARLQALEEDWRKLAEKIPNFKEFAKFFEGIKANAKFLELKAQHCSTLLKTAADQSEGLVQGLLEAVEAEGEVTAKKLEKFIQAHVTQLQSGIESGVALARKAEEYAVQAKAQWEEVLTKEKAEYDKVKTQIDGAAKKLTEGVSGFIANAKGKADEALKHVASKLQSEVVSPFNKLKNQLTSFEGKLATFTPDALKGKLLANIDTAYQRADREMRGLVDHLWQIKADLVGSADEVKTKVTQKVSEFLGGITGTVEHGVEQLARAQKLLDDLKTQSDKWAGQGIAKLEREAKTLLEKLKDVASLPWTRNLPHKVDLGNLERALRKFAESNTAAAKMEWDKAVGSVSGGFSEVRKVLEDLSKKAQGHWNELATGIAANVETGLNNFRARLNEQSIKIAGDLKSQLSSVEPLFPTKDELKQRIQGFSTGIDALSDKFKINLGEARQWLEGQREGLGQLVHGLEHFGATKLAEGRELTDRAARVWRAFGTVPKVPAISFKDMGSLDKLQEAGKDFEAQLKNYSNRIQNVSYQFTNSIQQFTNEAGQQVRGTVEAGERLVMTPIKALVDRAKTAGGEVIEEVQHKAATLEMEVRNIGKKLETDAKRIMADGQKALKDLLPDFGGLKLEKLLGAAGLSDKFIQRLKEKTTVRHGFDLQSGTAFVDSKMEGLVLDDSLTILNFGPVILRLRKVTLDSHMRVVTTDKGKVTREGDGKLVADWELVIGSQPVITYEQAALTCNNGKVKMELDPKKIRLPSAMQSIADAMKMYNSSGEDPLQYGVLPNLPTEITAFVRYNLPIPACGGGTSGVLNLNIALLFELAIAFRASLR